MSRGTPRGSASLAASTNLTPAERSLRARLASHKSWANTHDPAARTAHGTAAFLSRFEGEVDPDGTLDPAERARRAEHAKRAYMAGLALASTEGPPEEGVVNAERPGPDSPAAHQIAPSDRRNPTVAGHWPDRRGCRSWRRTSPRPTPLRRRRELLGHARGRLRRTCHLAVRSAGGGDVSSLLPQPEPLSPDYCYSELGDEPMPPWPGRNQRLGTPRIFGSMDGGHRLHGDCRHSRLGAMSSP